VSLCLWAGADPHTPAPHPGSGLSEEADTEHGEERFIGWTAMEEAAREGNLAILKRLGPDPSRDDFDDLYRVAKYESIVAFLATIQPPKDLTAILSCMSCGWRIASLGRAARELARLKRSSPAACGGMSATPNGFPGSGVRS